MISTNIGLASLATGALVAAAVLFPAPAQADPDANAAFLQELNAMGMQITDTALTLNQGAVVCLALDKVTGDVVVGNLVRSFGYSGVEANALLWASVDQLCPWHDHRGSTYVA